MKSYIDKLQELGVGALEENKEEIKKAIKDSQIELIQKSPQMLQSLLENILSGDDDTAEE
jgi:hypothetical protein